MQIAGNILAFLLVPISLIASASLLARFKMAGPDQVTPVLTMVVAVAARWLLGAVLIMIIAARGGFDGLFRQRVLAALAAVIVVFALDATAWMAGTAAARVGSRAVGIQVQLGQTLAWVLPLLGVLLLIVTLNRPHLSSIIERLAAGGLMVLAVIAFGYFNAINRATDAQRYAEIDAFNAEQQRAARPYEDALAAIALDAPADRYGPFFLQSDCPPSVRDLIVARLHKLPDLLPQLMAMLGDDRRALAMDLISYTGQLYEPGQINVLIDANVQLAAEYALRADANDDDTTATLVGRAASRATYFSAISAMPGVDFRRAIEAWHAALAHVHVQNADTAAAHHDVDQWLEFNAEKAGAK
jgi:hypothetical protein